LPGAEPVGTASVVAAAVVVDDIGRAVASLGVMEVLADDTGSLTSASPLDAAGIRQD
jgi:hypothetical protein